jgi:anti-sigma regulatory factor (Ser/Thr protein kinase)
MSVVSTDGCIHDAFFYDSDDELLTATVPFLRAGLDQGDTVVVVCSDRKNGLLVDALEDDPRIRVLPHADVYQRPPETVAIYREILDSERDRSGRVRLMGEIPYGEQPEEWTEWSRYESVLNRMLAPYPVWVVCGHDARELSAEVLANNELTHPSIFDLASSGPNPHYLDPEKYLRRSIPSHPDSIEATSPTLRIDVLSDLRALRESLHTTYNGQTRTAGVVRDFMTAIDEVATNAIRHGRPPVSVRLWAAPDRSVCTITDGGSGFDDLLANAQNPVSGDVGLWVVRHLCDQVDFSRGPTGFTVRLTTHY